MTWSHMDIETLRRARERATSLAGPPCFPSFCRFHSWGVLREEQGSCCRTGIPPRLVLSHPLLCVALLVPNGFKSQRCSHLLWKVALGSCAFNRDCLILAHRCQRCFMLCSVGTREVLLHSPDCATASEEEPSVAKTIALSLAPWGSEYSPRRWECEDGRVSEGGAIWCLPPNLEGVDGIERSHPGRSKWLRSSRRSRICTMA